MLRGKTTTQCRLRDELGGAKAPSDVRLLLKCQICSDLFPASGEAIAFDPEGSSLDRRLPVNNLG